MSVLDVWSALSDSYKSELFQNSANFAWLQDGGVAHYLGDGEVLGADKFSIHARFSIFEEHLDDLTKAGV